MRRFIKITLPFVILFIFVSCNDLFSNTNLVKDYIDAIDPSITLGEALDTYKYFSKTEWEEFTTERGQEVVEFKGYYFENDIVVRIQFLINKDWVEDENGNSFKLAFQGYKFKWEKDSQSQSFTQGNAFSKALIGALQSAIEKQFGVALDDDSPLMRIYKNKKLYFPNLINPTKKNN